MIWCEECGARLVLENKSSDSEESENIFDIKNIIFNHEINLNNDFENPLYFSVPLRKIHKVVIRDLYKYGIKEDEKNIKNEEIINFINSNFDLLKNPKFYLKAKNPSDYYISDSDSEIFIDTPDRIIDFNIGLEINDYNVNKAYKLCHNFDLSHDGICVYLQCYESENKSEKEYENKLFQVTYWGD